MDAISAEALNNLNTALQSLLPVSVDPTLAPDISIQLQSVTPTGVGGFVAVNDNPPGEILGRRIDATAVIGVKAAVAGIDAAAAAVHNALLAADGAVLQNLGLLKIMFVSAGETSTLSPALVLRPVSFRILYEFLKIPTDPEGIIQTIPLNIQLQS